MKNCPNCNKVLRDEAKFCGGCGYKITAVSSSLSCPKCNNPLHPGAKFCGKCGNKVQISETTATYADSAERVPSVNVVNSFIHWNILQGQLAVKIDENDIAGYGKAVKGIDIQEGVKALFFVHGKLVGELPSGHHTFKSLGGSSSQDDPRGVLQLGWDKIRSLFVGLWDRSKADQIMQLPCDTPYSFVLIRTNEFPLIYNLSNIPTATVSCNLGIHLLCKISNINDFYTNHLLERKFIGFEAIAARLDQAVRTQLTYALSNINPEQVSNTPQISDLLIQTLQPVISEIYPYIQLTRILNISARNEDLAQFQKMAEELYISERKLVELQKRNDFFNRLQGVQNEQEIFRLNADNAHGNTVTDINYAQEEHCARRDSMHNVTMQSISNAHELTDYRMSTTQDIELSKVESQFTAAKEKIYEEMALTEDERAKFDLMLSAQKKLREAKSEEDFAVATQEFRKSGLLREQEIENLQHQISHNAQFRDLNDAQALSMAIMQNKMALDRQSLEWEIQIGNKRIQNEFDRRRIEDAYNDEKRNKAFDFTDRRRELDAAFSDHRRNADATFEDSRRRANIDFDRLEQENQLDVLEKAQNIRMKRELETHRMEMERKEAEHQHELEIQYLEQESEKNRLDAANEEKRIYAGMTFEQIMAANPNLTPQAAQALAKKYEAEAAAAAAQAAMAQNDKIAQMAMDQKDQMVAFMQQQMAMMKDISMAGINTGASHQQAMYNEKQAELDRTRNDASANADRFVDGMKTTIQAVGNMNNHPAQAQYQQVPPPYPQQYPPQYQQVPPPYPQQYQQPSAHTADAPGTIKCPNCNTPNPKGAAFCSECGQSF